MTGRRTRSFRLAKVNPPFLSALSSLLNITLQVPGLVWGDGAYCCGITEISPHGECFRFFETEGIAIMTMLVSKYKIEIKEEPQFAGETFEERYARIMACDQAVTTV